MADKKSKNERLSLHGMTPEEAIQRAFGAPPKSKLDEESADCLIRAFSEFCENGDCNTICEVCGKPITFSRVAEQVHESNCGCGKYRDTFRGI